MIGDWDDWDQPTDRQLLVEIHRRIGVLMSQQDQVSADVAAVEGDVSNLAAAQAAIAAEIAALKAGNPALDLSGLDKAVADLGTATSGVQGLVPPPPPVVPAS